MCVDCACLGFSEAHEIDDVAEDLDKSLVCRFGKICKGKVCYAALSRYSVRFS